MLAYKNASNQTKVHPSDKDETDQQQDNSPVSEDDHIGQKKVGKWTPEEDELLRKYAPIYDEKQWRKISNHIPGRSSIQCLHRWTKILKPGLVKGPWTAEEDQKLLTWVRTEGPTKWAQAANFIKGRSGKQCRERWFNNLNPDVKKGNWSKMEDELIFELYQKYGTSWSKIAKYLPGRTENAIKNRFYSTLRKLAADKRKNKGDHPDSESEANIESPEETKLIPTLSTPGAAAALGMSSRLYKLLQDTAYVEEQNEQKESSTKDGKDGLDGGETSNNESPLKTAQDSAEKAKKIAVKKEGKMVAEHTPVTPAKQPRNENEDNDLIFEKFLLSLDESTEEDFLTKELDSHCDSEDLIHFDDLQQKILNYCQDNIHGLAEAFKDIANNDIDSAHFQERRKKSVSQVRPERNSASKVETTSNGVVQQNIKGIKISAPLITHINSNKKSSPLDMMPSAAKNQAINYTKNEDGHGQGYLMMPVSREIYGHMPSVEAMFNGQSEPQGYVKKEGVSNSHINTLNKLVDNAQEVGTKNNPEGEKRLTFLFQQLHSLEDLLKSTRNELMKLEGAFNQVDDKDLEKEIKAMVCEGPVVEAVIRPGDEEFELKKKRKV